MKKTTTLTLAIISLLLVFSSSRCKKGNDDICYDCPSGPQDTLYVEKEFLDYWYAETGSWWVFKRTDTIGVDIYDTMRVENHVRRIEYNQLNNRISAYEYVKLLKTHTLEDFEINSIDGFDVQIETPKGHTNSIYYGWKEKYNDTSYLLPWGTLDLHYPFILHSNETRQLTYKLENIIILSTPFGMLTNTLVIEDNYNLNVRFYISKNIGISRMELQGGQVWELIDYKVIQ